MTQGNAIDAGPAWPVDYEVTETCPVHNVMHTLGTGCLSCADDAARREADFYEAVAASRGEL